MTSHVFFQGSFKGFRAVDLTHTLHEKVPTWNGSCGFHHEIKMDYDQGLRVMKYECHAGIGTHMDAPSHFVQGAPDIADIPIEDLIVPVFVIPAHHLKEDGHLSAGDILHFEKKHSKIPPKSLVLAHTGWDKRWNEPESYRNKLRFPGIGAKAAVLLLEREIVGLGIDTLSPDGCDMSFPVHKSVLGRGKYILENVANLGQMPAAGAFAIVLPMKVREGSEAAVRAIGLCPQR
jgi:kynurenine formamidase